MIWTLCENDFSIDQLYNSNDPQSFLKNRGFEFEHNAEFLSRIGTDQDSFSGSIAVMPVFGLILQHSSHLGVSTEAFRSAFDRVDRSERYSHIVLHIHSPGGQATGVPELAARIRASKTPVTAVVNSMAASGGFYIASAADRIVGTPTSIHGSIGVVNSFKEATPEHFEKLGVKPKVFAKPEKKAEFAGAAPMSPESDIEMQEQVNKIYSMFRGDVANYRGVSESYVEENFGGGGVLLAEDALGVKMIDAISTLDEVVSELMEKPSQPKGYSAANRLRIKNAELSIQKELLTP